MQPAPASLRRTTVRVAVFVLAAVLVLSVAEATSSRFTRFTRDHALLTAFITEAILLVAVYLVIDQIIERRDARRWRDVVSLGLRALSTRADGPAAIIRRAVEELAVEGPVDHRQRVVELAAWLRADEPRARSFAQELRRSATRLEDAIIRWGPTLIEDPDSAELINLLPEIVDSARSAADAIAPATDWLGDTRVLTDSPEQRFEESVLEILEHAEEFDRRVSARL